MVDRQSEIDDGHLTGQIAQLRIAREVPDEDDPIVVRHFIDLAILAPQLPLRVSLRVARDRGPRALDHRAWGAGRRR